MLNEKVQEIELSIKALEKEVAILKENCEINRVSVNLLLDWAEDASIQTVPLHQRKTKDDSSL